MTTFKVGDVAIMCNATRRPYVNGMECTVTGPLRRYLVFGLDGLVHMGYNVRAEDGRKYFMFPHQLRKHRPPASDDAAARQTTLDCIERAKQPLGAPA